MIGWYRSSCSDVQHGVILCWKSERETCLFTLKCGEIAFVSWLGSARRTTGAVEVKMVRTLKTLACTPPSK